MPVEKWNESGRIWEDDHGLLDAEQVSKCSCADVAEPLRSPIPTRKISRLIHRFQSTAGYRSFNQGAGAAAAPTNTPPPPTYPEGLSSA